MSNGVQTQEEKLAAIRKAREDRQSAFYAAAKTKRQESELKLGEIEAETGKTLGIDLAAVFLPDGSLIVVKKPPAVVHNKIMMAQANNAVNDMVLSEYCAAVAQYPTPVECEKLFMAYPNARDAMVNAGIQLAGVDQSNMLGK